MIHLIPILGPPLRRREYFSLAITFACLVALIAPLLMPVVILDRTADLRRVAPAEVRAVLSGHKIRGCELVAGSFVGWYLAPWGWQEVPFEWLADTSPDSTRPRSLFERQRFGPALWREVPAAAREVRVTAQHNCGSEPPVVTVLGPYILPDPAP